MYHAQTSSQTTAKLSRRPRGLKLRPVITIILTVIRPSRTNSGQGQWERENVMVSIPDNSSVTIAQLYYE